MHHYVTEIVDGQPKRVQRSLKLVEVSTSVPQEGGAGIYETNNKEPTLEEEGNLVSALVDHVDYHLVVALSCFLALRSGEIAALKCEDFDSDSVHILRDVVRGKVGTPKTPESLAGLPLVDSRILIPLEVWRQKSGNPKKVGFSRGGTRLRSICTTWLPGWGGNRCYRR